MIYDSAMNKIPGPVIVSYYTYFLVDKQFAYTIFKFSFIF